MYDECGTCKFYENKVCNNRRSFFYRMEMDEGDECGTWEKKVENVNKNSTSKQLNTGLKK